MSVKHPFFKAMLQRHLTTKGLSFYRLAILCRTQSATINNWVRKGITHRTVSLLSSVPEVGVSYSELNAWRLLDLEPAESILKAAELIKAGQYPLKAAQ